MANVKELHFFDRHFERGVKWYAHQFDRAGSERAVGEATQSYMYDEEAFERLALTLPDARLVAILRNPVDRAYSHYWLNRALNRETLPFEQAITAEPERLARGDRTSRFRYSYVDRGMYARQLRRMSARFSNGSIHVVLFDDLMAEPIETYRSVCRFLDLDGSFMPADLGNASNRYATFRSVTVRQAGKRLPKALRRVIGRLNMRRAAYPPMDPSVRKTLLASFDEPNRELASWLGRDLSAWTA